MHAHTRTHKQYTCTHTPQAHAHTYILQIYIHTQAHTQELTNSMHAHTSTYIQYTSYMLTQTLTTKKTLQAH